MDTFKFDRRQRKDCDSLVIETDGEFAFDPFFEFSFDRSLKFEFDPLLGFSFDRTFNKTCNVHPSVINLIEEDLFGDMLYVNFQEFKLE